MRPSTQAPLIANERYCCRKRPGTFENDLNRTGIDKNANDERSKMNE